MTKRTLALILILAMVLSLAGCSTNTQTDAPSTTGSGSTATDSGSTSTPSNSNPGTSGEILELTYYYPTQVGGDVSMRMDELVERFNSEHPNIHVTPVYSGSYFKTVQAVITAIQGGNAPHVVLSGTLDVVDLINIKSAVPLNDLIAAEGEEWKNDFVTGFWEPYDYDGTIYALPFQQSVQLLVYNKDLLNAAGVASVPTNFEETIAACQKLMAYDKNLVPIEFPSEYWILEGIALSNGQKLAPSMNETALDSPGVVESLAFLEQLVDQEGALINDYATAAEDLIAGTCAMNIQTTGNLSFIAKNATFDWGVAAIPTNGDTTGLTLGGGGMVLLGGHDDAETAASWEFIKWMCSPEISSLWMTYSGYSSVRYSSAEQESTKAFYAQYPQFAEAADLLQYAHRQWTTNEYWTVYDIIEASVDRVLIEGSVTAAESLTQAQTEAMAALAAK